MVVLSSELTKTFRSFLAKQAFIMFFLFRRSNSPTARGLPCYFAFLNLLKTISILDFLEIIFIFPDYIIILLDSAFNGKYCTNKKEEKK